MMREREGEKRRRAGSSTEGHLKQAAENLGEKNMHLPLKKKGGGGRRALLMIASTQSS